MVAPAWLSDQHHGEHSSCVGRWTMALRVVSEKSVSEKMQGSSFVDVAMGPGGNISASYKNFRFHYLEENVLGKNLHNEGSQLTPNKIKGRIPRKSTPKTKYASLKKFSKTMINNLVDEQLVKDNLAKGSIGFKIHHVHNYDPLIGWTSEMKQEYTFSVPYGGKFDFLEENLVDAHGVLWNPEKEKQQGFSSDKVAPYHGDKVAPYHGNR